MIISEWEREDRGRKPEKKKTTRKGEEEREIREQAN